MSDKPAEITYPASKKLNVSYSAYEDRLLVRAERPGIDDATLLMTRRMTLLLLQNVLSRLPELSGLDKTPAAYWQEVLQMDHQGAMEAKSRADTAEAEQHHASGESVAGSTGVSPAIYLATELTIQASRERLTLAFRGLHMPDAMTKVSKHVPILAIPLSLDNVHQLIELIITKAREAGWHLPVDLPWLDSLSAVTTAADVAFRAH